MSPEHREIWEKRKIAKFLNSSYEYVDNMPWDEFLLCRYLLEIEGLLNSKEGVEVLKNNIRYQQTDCDVGKLRKRYGKDGVNG